MKTLWAPWRMAYIAGETRMAAGCIFEAAPGKNCSREHHILLRRSPVVVLMNRFPYANGHLLVAPVRHLAEFTELNAEENLALIDMLQQSVMILRKHLAPDGFNIGLNLGAVAGAGLADHLHFHIVPRWEGDHNFMTVMAEVRSIPEHLDATFDRLLPDFLALGEKTPPAKPTMNSAPPVTP